MTLPDITPDDYVSQLTTDELLRIARAALLAVYPSYTLYSVGSRTVRPSAPNLYHLRAAIMDPSMRMAMDTPAISQGVTNG